MTKSPATEAPTGQPPSETARFRLCLRCQAAFQSEWFGERICARCKGSTGWRQETPLKTRQ